MTNYQEVRIPAEYALTAREIALLETGLDWHERSASSPLVAEVFTLAQQTSRRIARGEILE